MEKLSKTPRLHHRGRAFQVPIYFGKLLRSFIYMNDWKLLPMAAVIAALISMVVRNGFFVNVEGTIKGCFALTCVAVWNGCFNSIQVICRERPVIKREHRSGMHIFSYITSHMLYQALLCLAQSAITLWVCKLVGVKFIETGVVTGSGVIDIGITVFLVTYSADMMSLLISAVAHNTTSAMTVMPFILIFQLVFSGGIFTLPAWTDSISQFTISHYGMQCFSAQSDQNKLPMVTAWNTIEKMNSYEVKGELTIAEIYKLASEKGLLEGSRDVKLADKEAVDQAISSAVTAAFAASATGNMPEPLAGHSMDILTASMKLSKLVKEHDGMLLGDLIDLMDETALIEAIGDTPIPYDFTVGQAVDAIGRDKLRTAVQTATATTMYKSAYENTVGNVAGCWIRLVEFSLFFALCSMVMLKFIDKDKR